MPFFLFLFGGGEGISERYLPSVCVLKNPHFLVGLFFNQKKQWMVSLQGGARADR